MTTELIKAAQQALEAWQTACYGQPSHQRAMLLAMTELRKMVERTTELSDRGHRDALLVARDAIEQEKALSHRAGYKQGYQQGKADALTQRPAAQTEREAFLLWWAGTGMTLFQDTAFAAWQARASLPAPQQAPPEPVGERWVVVRETALDVGRGSDVRTGGRPELGYALISDAATFGSEDEAVAAIKNASLPVGWVVLPLSRLLPDLGATPPQQAAGEPVGEPHTVAAQTFEAMRASGASENYAVRRALDVAVAEWVKRAKADGLIADTRPAPGVPEPLTVRIRNFPESNGKRNWTAMFVRTQPWDGLIGNAGGITIDHGEYWNRVAYEAERARCLLGERVTEPDILAYATDVMTPDEWKGHDPESLAAAQAKGGAA